MLCPNCRFDNPDEAKFCNQCGTRLGAAAAAPARTSYTPRHLAEKVLKARGAMIGERKRVTVLFADIKGSTQLAEQAGAEAWHGILDRFFAILSESVHRYEGTVNQYTGDGIMALFGAPIAHEDHAQRACFAALAMQADIRKFADDLRLKQGINLTLRVGINTGEVIVGRIGDDLRMDYTAQGHTVNLAARMEQICEPGRIYLTRNTAQLVEGYFSLRDLGESPVRGVDKPVPVFDLEGEGPMRTRLERQLARIGSRFIGREEEMSCLHAALERARGGEGQVIAVIGNAGIGKSRLCHEFTEACQRAGVAVHRCTGVPYASALPLYPVQNLLKSRLRLPERCTAEETRRLVAGTFLLADPANAAVLPAILDFLGVGDNAARAPDVAAEAREKMLALLARWLPRPGDTQGPQVLLIEDLHFADPATEEFLARLCKEARATKTLVLLNYRPEYVSERLIPLLDEQIQVTALTAEQVCDLARVALGPHPSLKGVPERICARANGNPYYAEEAVQALVDEGHVEGETGNYVLVKPIEQWRIPDTVHALISARIDRLPEEPKGLLHFASVIGQEFRPALLAELAAIEAEPFETGIAVLEESGFVHARDEAAVGRSELRYRFCHPLVQEVAYHTQLESQRARAHARLAGTLEKTHPLSAEPTEASVQIAHHWAAAGEWTKAGLWSLNASRYLVGNDIVAARNQFCDAMRHFDRAPDTPETVKGRMAARAGVVRMAQFVATPDEDVERAFAEGQAMAQKAGDLVAFAELSLAYANELLHRGDAQEAVRLTTEAVERAVSVGAGELIHRFRLGVLLVYASAGYPREGLEIVNKAAGTAWLTEPIGLENFLSRGFYGVMLSSLGRLAEAESNLTAALDFAVKADRDASWMHSNLVDLDWFYGRRNGRAMAAARKGVERAELSGSPFFRIVALRGLALAHVMQGTGAQVIALLEAARPHVAPGGLGHQFEANFLSALAECYLQAGADDKAEQAAEEAIASGQRSRSRAWEIRAWIAWMDLPVSAARRARAAEGLARMQGLIDDSGAEGYRPWLCMAREKYAETPAEKKRCREAALQAFEKIGAADHVARLSRNLG